MTDQTGATVIWVSGASSGIGAAFVDAVPDPEARVIGVSRRANPRIDNIRANLGDPASWGEVEASFRDVLADEKVERAIFFHCAGTVAGDGYAAGADVDAYREGVLLNSCAGQVLGRAFLGAAAESDATATLVMCSSPSASLVTPGLSHYCAGKASQEMWVKTVAAELGGGAGVPRIFAVVPWAVDTAIVRTLMDEDEAEMPIAGVFREAADNSELATPPKAAAEIWDGIESGVPQGGRIHVGAVPPDADVVLQGDGFVPS